MLRPLLIPTIVTFAAAMGALPGSSQQASQHAVLAQTVYTTVITLEYDRPVARGVNSLGPWSSGTRSGRRERTGRLGSTFPSPLRSRATLSMPAVTRFGWCRRKASPGRLSSFASGTRITACSHSGPRSFGRWWRLRPEPTWRSWLSIFRWSGPRKRRCASIGGPRSSRSRSKWDARAGPADRLEAGPELLARWQAFGKTVVFHTASPYDEPLSLSRERCPCPRGTPST